MSRPDGFFNAPLRVDLLILMIPIFQFFISSLSQVIRILFRSFNFRGKDRLLHALSPKQGEQIVEMYGYRIKLDLSDYIQRSIYLHTYEPDESSLVKNYLKRGMTFVDVGANVGYYTLMAALLVGNEGIILAFEPSPYAFDRLMDTIKMNHLPQVRAIQAGLSNSSGELPLYMPKMKGNHTPSMIANERGNPISVRVHRLDEYLAANNIGHVNLMKIDVEGFEPNVIGGAKNYIKEGRIQAVLCEFNKYWLEANNSSPSQLYEELIRYGYQPENMKPDFNIGVQNLFFTRQ